MKEEWFRRLWIFIVLWVFLTSYSWAGEVVTKDVRLWAKKAIEEEKALRPIEGRNTVAVLYFQNKTGKSELDPLQKGLVLMLITDLSTVKGLQIVERVRLQALMEEMGFGVSGLVESHTAPRVGRLLGAQWLIGGEIAVGSLQIQSNLLDVQGQKIIGQPLAKGELTDLFRIEKNLLLDIIKLLKIEVTPREQAELRRPCSTNMKALVALFKGIEASDRGNYEKAAEFYESALKEDPNICVARGAFQELINLRLITAKKRSRELLNSLRDRSSITDQLFPEDSIKRERIPTTIPPEKVRTYYP